MDNDRQAQLYAELMGTEALARQSKLKKETCPECWGQEGKHAAQCRRGYREAMRKEQERQNPRRR